MGKKITIQVTLFSDEEVEVITLELSTHGPPRAVPALQVTMVLLSVAEMGQDHPHHRCSRLCWDKLGGRASGLKAQNLFLFALSHTPGGNQVSVEEEEAKPEQGEGEK